MNTSIIKSACISVSLLGLLAGCVSMPDNTLIVEDVSELPAIQEIYKEELSKLKIGVSLEEFKKMLPKSFVGGQSKDTTGYEINHITRYVTGSDYRYHRDFVGFGSPRIQVHKQVLWFYFYTDRLVQWGRPSDWPKDPKQIIDLNIKTNKNP